MHYFLYVIGTLLAAMGIIGYEQANNSIHQGISMLGLLGGVVAISGAAITRAVNRSNELLERLTKETDSDN